MAAIIEKKYPVTDTRQLASELGLSYSSLHSYANRNGIEKLDYKHTYTQEEEALLVAKYPITPTEQLAKEMGISVSSLYNKAYALGLKKIKEYFTNDVNGNLKKLAESGRAHRFTKGLIPHNKGKKMSPELYGKCRGTMFQKGLIPHNSKFDGYERISKEGYRERRVAPGKFRPVNHLVWEEVNGPVPANHIIIFRDGNKLNCDISNLECISREENCNRNSIVRYPPELRSLIRINHKLKREINGKKQNG